MGIEQKLYAMLQQSVDVDTETMLSKFHSARFQRQKRKQQMMKGLMASMIIILVGFLSINQFDISNKTQIVVSTAKEKNSELTQEMVEEFAVYLVDESDDVWETIEFLNEIGYEPVTNIVNGGS